MMDRKLVDVRNNVGFNNLPLTYSINNVKHIKQTHIKTNKTYIIGMVNYVDSLIIDYSYNLLLFFICVYYVSYIDMIN